MRTEPFDKAYENERTEEAWRKLREKLAGEAPGEQWKTWAEAAKRGQGNQAMEGFGADVAGDETDRRVGEEPFGEAVSANAAAQEQPARKRMRMSRRRKWSAAAAACLVLGAVIATPAGNEALAAILNQFRAQQITVVNEGDLRSLFESVGGGEANFRETVNKFGTYTTESGKVEGEFTIAEAERLLGYKPVVAASDGKKVSISPSTTVSFKMNVGEVNDVMKRLGATTLMPEAIDGKPVTLELGERVYYDGESLGAKGEEWAYLYEQKAPVVTVDPSVPVEEALEAVLDFPLLPDYLKRDLQQSRILEGKLPIPMIEGQQTEKLDVEGTQVVLTSDGDNAGFRAAWIHDGRLYEFEGGNLFKTREAVLKKIGELIA